MSEIDDIQRKIAVNAEKFNVIARDLQAAQLARDKLNADLDRLTEKLTELAGSVNSLVEVSRQHMAMIARHESILRGDGNGVQGIDQRIIVAEKWIEGQRWLHRTVMATGILAITSGAASGIVWIISAMAKV